MAKKNTTQLIIDDIVGTHVYVVEQYKDRLDMIRKNNSMVNGNEGQWDPKLLAQLQSQDRPTHSFNIELPLVLQLLGSMTSNPRRVVVKSADGFADDKVAEVLTKLLRQIDVANDQDFLDDQWFTAGVIGYAGWLYIETSFEEDPLGEIKVSIEDNTDVLPDPDAKRTDQSDWKYVIRRRWMSWSDIKFKWSDKVTEAKADVPSIWERWTMLLERLQDKLRGKAQDDLLDKKNDLYRVIEKWVRKKERVVHLLNPETEGIEVIKKGKESAELIRRGFMPLWEGTRKYLEVNVVLPYADVLLESKKLNYEYYPFAGYYPLKFSGLPLVDSISYVENIHSMQEEKNRYRSIMVDTLQRSPVAGGILPAGEGELKKDLEQRGSKPGTWFARSGNAGKIQFLNQPFPVGYQYLDEMNTRDIVSVSAMPLAQGGHGDDDSGVLFQSRVRQGMISMGMIFSSFARAKRLKAKIILERIQKDYTEQRIFRVIGEKEDEIIEINQQDVMGRILNDTSLGKYDIWLSEAPYDQTHMEEQFKSLAEMAKVIMPMVPPHIALEYLAEIIENTTLDNKKELAEKLKLEAQKMAAQPQLPEGQQQQQSGGNPTGVQQQLQ